MDIRKMKIKRRAKDSYIAYLESYLIVLVVPMLITIMGYIYSNKMIDREVLNYQNSILSRTQGIGDQIVGNHVMSKGFLISNKQLNNLMEAENWSGSLMFDIKTLKTDLTNLANSNNIIADAQVYFPQSGNLLTTKRRYPPHLTYIYTDSVGIQSEYDNIIDKKKVSGYYVLKEGTSDCSIYFYQNLFDKNYKNILATIVTVLKWEDVAHLLGGLGDYSDGVIFMINQNNQILGSSNFEMDISSLSYDFFQQEGKLIQTKLGNESYICSYTTSDVMDLKYVICIPRKVYYQKNSLLLLVIIIELILCIFLGSSLAIYFSKRTYNPVERVLNQLNTIRQNEECHNHHIFDNLEASMTNLLSDYRLMERQLQNQNDLLHDKILIGILSGTKRDDILMPEYKKQLQGKMENQWGTDQYYVVLVRYNKLEESCLATCAKEDDDVVSWALFSIKNVFQETLYRQKWGLLTEIDNSIVCVVPNEETLSEKLSVCIAFFRKEFHLEIYCTVSMLHQGVEEFSLAYEEAINTMNFKSFWAEDVEDIIFYEESQVHGRNRTTGRYAEQIRKIGICLSIQLTFLIFQDFQSLKS